MAYLIIASSFFMLSSCQHKELCYDHNHTVQLDVSYDWSKSNSASPSSMVLFLFPIDGATPLMFQFSSKEGGKITVPFGRYKMLSFNSDTENILQRGTESLSSFEIYTRETSVLSGMSIESQSEPPTPTGNSNEPIIVSPDMVWSDRINDDEGFLLSLDDPTSGIVFTPEQNVIQCSIKIRDVDNLKYIRQASGAISGMSGSVSMSTTKNSNDSCTIPFEVSSDGVATLTANFNCFGHCPEEDTRSHIMTIYFVLTDGTKWYYSIDVTNKMHEQTGSADKDDISIIIENLPIPSPSNSGAGFNVDVGGWQNVVVDLPM